MDEDLTIRARLIDQITEPARTAKASIDALSRSTHQAGRGVGQFGQSAVGLGRLRSAFSGLTGHIRQVGSEAVSAGSRVAGAFGNVATAGINRAKAGLVALGRGFAMAGVAAVGFGLKSFASLESQQMAFETLLGSVANANRLMAEMKSFASKTPYEFLDVAQSSKLLLAGGWKQDSIIPTLTKIGDAASAVSVPIDRVLMQITQMSATKAINWADMRVLSQTGLPVLEILGEKLKMTGQQVREMMSQDGGGKKLFEMGGLNALIDGLGERYKGMMMKQSTTMVGLMSTLKDTFTLGLGEAMGPLANGFIKPFIVGLIPKLEKSFNRFKNISRNAIQGFQVGGVRGALVGIDQQTGNKWRLAEKFDRALPTIRAIWGFLVRIGNLTLGALGTAFDALKSSFQFILRHREIFTSLAIAVGILVAGLFAIGVAVWAISAAPAVLLAVAILAVITAIVLLIRNWDKVKAAFRNSNFGKGLREISRDFKAGFNAIKRDFSAGIGVITGGVRRFASNFKAGFGAITGGVRRFASNFKAGLGVIGGAGSKVWSNFKAGLGVIGQGFSRAWAAVRRFGAAIGRLTARALTAIANAARTVWRWIRQAWNATSSLRSAIGRITARGFDLVWQAVKKVWDWVKKGVDQVGKFVSKIATVTSGPIDALAGAFGSVVDAVRTAIDLVRQLGDVLKTINLENFKAGAGFIADKISGPFKRTGDTSSPRVPVRGFAAHGAFSRTAGMHRALSTSGGIRVTSGLRNHSLGSFNSAHKRGNALDLVGSGLDRYKTRLEDIGGFAEYHGSGPSRHLHAEYPIGDTGSPRVAARGAGPGKSSIQNVTINVSGSGLTRDELQAVMVRTMHEVNRNGRERSASRR
jgi:hypothetical protein